MSRIPVALFAAGLALSACTSGSSSTFATSADAAVLAQLAAVGVSCTPELPRPAVEACAGKAAGDACTVTREGMTVTAKCGSDDGVLMCGADEDAEGLPPALTDPCAGKVAADACTVAGDEHSFDGVCTAVHSGSLACLPPPPPPPPPVAACSGKQTGDACSFGDPASPHTGNCYPACKHDTLVCLPAPPPEPPRVAACDGKMVDDACMVTFEDRTRSGTCQQPSGSALICVLAPPAPPKVTVDACVAHAAGDACSFTWEDDDTVNGACTPAADGTLVCAPACQHHSGQGGGD